MLESIHTPHTRLSGTKLRLAVLALGIGLSAGLVGCSGPAETDTDISSSSSTTSEAATDESTETAEAGDAAVGEGDVSVTVDGQAIEIDDATTVCQTADGTVTIAVGAATGTNGIGALLSDGDSPTVKSVALGSVDGTAMGWAEGAPGEASVTKDGNTYTISGSMMAVDASDPTAAGEQDFEMSVTCP